jgi:hypothetical protein
MIAAYFEKGCDSRSLFDGRKLSESENWDKNLNKYDVIRVDMAYLLSAFGNPDKALDELEKGLISDLNETFPNCLSEGDTNVPFALDKINDKTGTQFIIIIDEWDCLFRDEKSNTKIQERYVNLLRALFKGNNAKKFTALAYITGILPIKKYSSESALNNFYEYTMTSPEPLAKYIGFTEDEVKALCEKYDMDYNKVMEWYDGYSFEGAGHICGPNSVVRAMLSHKCNNYWSQTVAYNSLATYITMNFDGLRDAIVSVLAGNRIKVRIRTFENDMVSFKRKDDVLTALIHLGYLAYDTETEEAYIPNKEVRMCFEDTLEDTGWDEVIKAVDNSERLLKLTLAGAEMEVAELIDECHAENTSILKYNDENSFASCIALAYYTARKDYTIIRELPSGYGFADMVFLPKPGVEKPAMIVELKWNKKAETAIDQIKNNKYIKALNGYKGEILLVGISYEKDGAEAKKHRCVIEHIK